MIEQNIVKSDSKPSWGLPRYLFCRFRIAFRGDGLMLAASPGPLRSIACLGLLLLVAHFSCGCRSFPPPKAVPAPAKRGQFIPDPSSNAVQKVVIHIPAATQHFDSCQKLNPIWWLGNADEPVPPDWYRPGKTGRNVMWYLRNPFHNLNFFVIGISDKTFTRAGRFPAKTFNPCEGWNWSVCRYYRLRFPFISYSRNRVRAYFGWRTGGAFGIELKLNAQERSATPAPEPK